MFALVVLGVFLAVAGAASLIAYNFLQKVYREEKNYERGLKMVPLLIHLPPSSQDVDTSGRDSRDAVDENISRAQVLYNILASTSSLKGFKAKLYGQRHLAFEIIAAKGSVQFYTAVPISLLAVVEQAIVSAYPSAKLEEVADHNVFDPLGKLAGTAGGELVLKEKFAYPIGTYQDIKRDTMQAILNALSTLQNEDGAGIQILLRPAHSSWRKNAIAEAEKKRKGGKSKKGFELGFWWISQIITALTKPPESKGEGDGSKDREVSTLDQSVIQAIEDKTKEAGYEVLIRLVASSAGEHRSRTVLNNIVASFALFDAPGKNGFKFVPAKDMANFVSSYILRIFPQEQSSNILNSSELSTLFHFPDQKSTPTTQLERQASKQVDGPRVMPTEGLLLGYNMFRGNKKAIRLGEKDRRRHLYAVGQTGTGKSWFMQNLAIQDMLDGRGFAFIDPHGDAVGELLAKVPRERAEDIIYFSPSDMDHPLGLNIFETQTVGQKDFIIQEVIQMLYKLYDPQRQGIIGPRYEHIFRNCALAIMADPAGGSFIDIPKLLRDPQFVAQKLKHVTDHNVLEFWQKEMPQAQRSQEFGDIVSWFVSKFGAFLSNEMMRNIIGQNKSAFNLREVMDEKKILLVNLSRGRVGELNSKLLGMIFVMKFQAAAMSRADMPEEDRNDFCLYVDEFQNFSTDSFADILSEARKYRLNLIVANQFTTQLSDEIRDAVFGNVGSIVSFRVGTNDAEFLSKQFAPTFDIDDLQFLPNANTVTRMLVDGVPTQPFSMATIPLLGTPNPKLAEALKQLSAAKHGRPKAVVEEEIIKRMATVPAAVSPSPLGSNPFQGAAASQPAGPILPPGLPQDRAVSPMSNTLPSGGQSARPQASGEPTRPTTGSTFLDQWLAKRKSNGALRPVRPVGTVASAPSEPQSSASSPGAHIDLRVDGAAAEELAKGHSLKIDNS